MIFTLSIVLSTLTYSAVYEGTVTKIELGPTYGNIVHIGMSFDNPTSCASNTAGYDYSFDSEGFAGKNMYAALLAAQRSNSIIKVSGTGECTINTWGLNTENINWIQSL